MLSVKSSLKTMYYALKKPYEICVASEMGRSTCPLSPSKWMAEKELKRQYLHLQGLNKIWMLNVASDTHKTVTFQALFQQNMKLKSIR